MSVIKATLKADSYWSGLQLGGFECFFFKVLVLFDGVEQRVEV